MSNSERLYLYPVWIRLWHLTNAILCLVLIVTGLSIQFSNPSVVLQFKVAVAIHNIAGVLLTLSYVVFFLGNLFTVNGKYYIFEVKGFITRLMKQFRYYTIGIFRKETPPFPVTMEQKFNPLQQFSYVILMYVLVPLAILSGIGLLYPQITVNSLLGTSGLNLTDLLHITAGFLITVFLCIHIYFCTIGKTSVSNFKSMIDGYHESH
ncbi:MAG TPA: cytochrome b/b6 domain-containing protein [Bacteroidales bacterium]|nr:cytochrome b/b6 domain-containing protein [Bacteroidales bacterium]HPT08892.1 cytochrome b/b6 domain-containing protein [Bacteroidales bacterium]